MSLLLYREAVIAAIHAALPELRDVSPHEGRFSADSLKRFTARAPGVRLAVLALENPSPTSSGETDWMVRSAAFVVTKNMPGLKKDAAALNIVQALVTLITDNRFGLAFAKGASPPKAQTMMSTDLGKSGATIWVVEWTQSLRLGVDELAVNGVVPTNLYLGFAPEIGAAHEDDYIQITGAGT